MIYPTCANCKEELICDKNDVPVIHFIDNKKSKGIDAIRWGDIWKCPNCNCRVVIGMGKQTVGYDFSEENIKKILEGKYIEIKRSTE